MFHISEYSSSIHAFALRETKNSSFSHQLDSTRSGYHQAEEYRCGQASDEYWNTAPAYLKRLVSETLDSTSIGCTLNLWRDSFTFVFVRRHVLNDRTLYYCRDAWRGLN